MEQANLAEVLAESFWNGWVPTDLNNDYIEVLEYTNMGADIVEEINDVVHRWEQSFGQSPIDQALCISQLVSLRNSIEQRLDQANQVERPQHPALDYMLKAIQAGIEALVNSCTTVITGIQCHSWPTLRTGVHCAEKASNVLQAIYDGTHYTGE